MEMMGILLENLGYLMARTMVSERWSFEPAAPRGNCPAVRAKVPPPLQQAMSTAETRPRAAQCGEGRRFFMPATCDCESYFPTISHFNPISTVQNKAIQE